MTKPRATKGNTTKCPQCGALCRTIRSEQLSPAVREITYRCTDESCAHIFVAQLTPVRTLSPSRLLAPAVPPPPATAGGGRL